MKFSFTKFKDRTSETLYRISRWLTDAPKPIRNTAFGLLRLFAWAFYAAPYSHVRLTAGALARAIDGWTARKIYAGFVDGVVLFAQRIEQLSQGNTGAIDKLLHIPEQDRFDALLKSEGGALLALPHCHGALLMVRGLASRYPTLMLIREPKKDERAAAQRRYFANLGCDVLDVRRNNDAIVARTVLKALRDGKIVIGTVDRIKQAPPVEEPISKTSDNVRAEAFGAPIGVAGWPARFAAKCKVPILPVMAEQTSNAIVLHIGDPIAASDILSTTQKWVDALQVFFSRFPDQWIFVYDKHWSRLLRNRNDK